MHILVGILTVIGAIVFFLIRMNGATRSARDLADAASELANLPRKVGFQSRSGKTGIDLIDDPRDAAMLTLVLIARAKGDVTVSQKKLMRSLATEAFGYSDQHADDLLTQISWLARDVAIEEHAIGKMVALIRRDAGDEALASLHAMAAAAGEADGPTNARQRELIDLIANTRG